MIPPLFRVGLILTLRCNAECRHCMFECSPEQTEVMPRRLAEKAIQEARSLGAEWVSLTGGEPFLEPDLLQGLIAYAHENGLKTEVVTNGFWGESLETAKNELRSLIDAGLDVLNLSIDDFHEEYLSIEKVRNAYLGAVELGLKVVLMVSTSPDSRLTSDTIPPLLGDDLVQIPGKTRIRNPNAVLFETQFTPVGRGAGLSYVPSLFTRVKCSEVLRDIGVKPNGDVLPCCGPLGTAIPLGNLPEDSLESILEKARNNPRLTRIQDGFDVDGRYSSKCHACLEN